MGARFAAMAVACAGLLANIPQSSAEPIRSWTLNYSPDERLHKLTYGAPSSDSLIYFRCTGGEGFIIVLFDAKARTKAEVFSSGGESVAVPARFDHDEVEGGIYGQAAIPADNEVFAAMIAGNALRHRGAVYPISTTQERETIAEFIRVCGGRR